MGPDRLAPLQARRLRLRCVTLGDAPALSALMTPAVSRWMISWPVPFTPEMAKARICRSRAALSKGEMLPFAIERLSDDACLGWFSVTRTAQRRALLSYWLGEEHHGQGYLREAMQVGIPAAFRLLDLDVIEAEAQVENGRSLAVMLAFGMVPLCERLVFAPARDREEQCVILELRRPDI